MQKIKIIIADDHRLVRDGIKSLLKIEEDIEFIGEVEDGVFLMEMLQNLRPDVILMDINMPKMNGIEATAHISKDYPEISVIILSMHEEPEYILKCVESGASAYLLKSVEKDELMTAIRKAAIGKKYFNSDITALLALGITEHKKNIKEEIEITQREREVLACVANGLSTKQIADKLYLSARTIETHRLNLLKKFNAQNTAELIKIALAHKLITL